MILHLFLKLFYYQENIRNVTIEQKYLYVKDLDRLAIDQQLFDLLNNQPTIEILTK